MRLILLLVFVGFAVAFPHNAFDNLEVVSNDFLLKLEDDYAFAEDNDLKTELAKDLRKHLDDLLEKIKDAIANGKAISKDLLNKLTGLKEKIKNLKTELGDKAKEMLDSIKEKIREFFKILLDKLGTKEGLKQQIAEEDLTKLLFDIKDILLNEI